MMFVLHTRVRVPFNCRIILSRQLVQVVGLQNSVQDEKLILLNSLGLSTEETKWLIDTNKDLSKLTSGDLSRLSSRLQKLGFSTKSVLLAYPNILKYHHYTIDQRYKCLEEGGFQTITLQDIERGPTLHRKPIAILKEVGIIPIRINVTRNILSHTELPPDMYPTSSDEMQLLVTAQTEAVKLYLKWLFDLTNFEIEKKFKTYWFKYKSVRLIKQNLDILRSNFQFPMEKIRRHMYLLSGHPENLQELLEKVPMVGEKSLQHVANLAPRLLLRSTDSLLEILQIFEDDMYDVNAVSMFPEILTLGTDTVKERLKILYSDPQFKYLVNNIQLFKTVSNFRNLTERAKILKQANWRCYSASILSGDRQEFDRRVKLRPDYYRGSDICHFLHKEMDLAHQEVRRLLSKHSLWHFVPIVTISTTLDYLRLAGFSHDIIASCLPLLLYPKSAVEKVIQGLENESEVDCCRGPDGRVLPQLALQLVLYYLERPFHFNGNGVWELDLSQVDT